MLRTARGHCQRHRAHPVPLGEVLVVEQVGVAHEARVGSLQQLRGDVREVAHHQHRQIGVAPVEACIGLHHRHGAQHQRLPQPVGVEAQARGTQHKPRHRTVCLVVQQHTTAITNRSPLELIGVANCVVKCIGYLSIDCRPKQLLRSLIG
jgi:hypothetical protein